MAYYILYGASHHVECLQCKYSVDGHDIQRQIQDCLEQKKSMSKYCRYYDGLIYDLMNSSSETKTPVELIMLQDIWCFLRNDAQCIQQIFLTNTDQIHATSNAKIWHGYPIEVIKTWNLDMDFMYYLMDNLGTESVLENMNVFVNMAIRHRDWKWYQWLLSMYPEHVCACEINTFRWMSMEDSQMFYSIASPWHKVKILIHNVMSDTNCQLLLKVDYSCMSQAEINSIACQLMPNIRNDFLKRIYMAGLHFDCDCVISDMYDFYEKVYMKSWCESHSKINVLDAEFIEYFRELGFYQGCFQVCYLQSCLNCDLETVKKLQSEMDENGMKLAVRLAISMYSQNDWYQTRHNLRCIQRAETGEILLYLLRQLQPDEEWIIMNLQDVAELATMRDYFIFKHLTTNWPHHINQILAKWSRIDCIEIALRQQHELPPDIDIEEFINYIQTWPKIKSSANKIFQFSLRADVPLDTRIVLTNDERKKFLHLFDEEISWMEYLIFVAGVRVAEVLQLAALQNIELPDSEFFSQKFQIPNSGKMGMGICYLHDKCFYDRIMNSDLEIIYADLVANNLIKSEIINSICHWRKNHAQNFIFWMPNSDDEEESVANPL